MEIWLKNILKLGPIDTLEIAALKSRAKKPTRLIHKTIEKWTDDVGRRPNLQTLLLPP